MESKQYPEPTVGALIFNRDGKIFLMRSFKWGNRYVIPGGHIELGEKMVAALKREILEETGMQIYDITFFCFFEHIFENEYWKKKHLIFFDFVCKTNGEHVKLNAEADKWVWISLKEALELPLEYYTKSLIKKYLNEFK